MVILWTAPSNAFTGFIRAKDGKILDGDGAAIRLRGIGLEWDSGYGVDSVVSDLRRIGEIGANAVRIVTDVSEWEGVAATESFMRMDTIVSAAGRRGVRVVLGLDCDDWENSDVQERIVRVWMAIALRYRHDPRIAAYELMGHPFFRDAGSYRLFAQYLIDTIREIDTEHLLIATENAGSDVDGDDFTLNDPNLAYGFAEYHPDAFTRQGLGRRMPGVTWPGEYVVDVEEVSEWSRRSTHGTHNEKRLKIEVIAPEGAAYVSPRVYIQGGGRGHFGRVKLEELSIFDRKASDSVLLSDTFSDRATFWWQDPPEARLSWERSDDITGEGRIVLEGDGPRRIFAQPYTLFDIQRLPKAHEPERYRLTATVTGDHVDEAGIGIVFLKATRARSDSALIDARMKARAKAAEVAGAPMLLMEFGATRQAPGTSAVEWSRAVIAACERHGISWHYRVFREFDDPERRDERHKFAIYRAPASVSTDTSVIWPELHGLLWNSYKRMPALVMQEALDEPPVAPRSNPVPPPAGCWFGAAAPVAPATAGSPTNFSSIMAFARRAGRSPAWVAVHAPWKDERGRWTKFPEETFREIAAAGSIPFLAWEPRIPAGEIPAKWILDGHADTYIREFSDESRRFRDTFVMRLTRGVDASVYLHVFEIFEGRGAANVSWMWMPVLSFAGEDDADSLVVESPAAWPGANAVDWIGLSVYDRADLDETGVTLRLFPAGEVGTMLDRVARYGKPVCLAEVACEASRGQGQWWTDTLRQLRRTEFSAIRSFVLVESLPAALAGSPDFRLKADAAPAIQREVANPYFVGSD